MFYERPEEATTESDERILKSPDRLKARNEIIRKLKTFTGSRWWNTPVSDLNPCYLRGKSGALNAEQRDEYTSVEFQQRLMGNSQIRLILMPDPHYQNYFSGANGYLLVRQRGKVYVTEVLDGYYSRLANSVSLKLYRLNAQPVAEIETANISAMKPEYWSYYFVIDKKTNKAVAKELKQKGKRLFLR